MKSFLFFVSLLMLFGCSDRITSYALVGESMTIAKAQHEEYRKFFQRSGGEFNSIIRKDTLGFSTYVRSQPIESISIFKNDTCVFQEINIYCSPCADKAVQQLLSDKRYKFEAVDERNYMSTTELNVIMRLKSIEDSTSCSNVTIRSVGKFNKDLLM